MVLCSASFSLRKKQTGLHFKILADEKGRPALARRGSRACSSILREKWGDDRALGSAQRDADVARGKQRQLERHLGVDDRATPGDVARPVRRVREIVALRFSLASPNCFARLVVIGSSPLSSRARSISRCTRISRRADSTLPGMSAYGADSTRSSTGVMVSQSSSERVTVWVVVIFVFLGV